MPFQMWFVLIRFWINCPLRQGLLEHVLLGWTKEKDSLRGFVCSQKGTNRRGKCEPAFVAELRKNQVACLTEVGSCFALAHTFRCLFAMKDVLSSVKLFQIQTNSSPLCFIQIDFKMCLRILQDVSQKVSGPAWPGTGCFPCRQLDLGPVVGGAKRKDWGQDEDKYPTRTH